MFTFYLKQGGNMSLIKMNFILSLLFIFLPCFALEKDTKEKVIIIADSGIYNYKTGLNIYNGHVRVDQGTSHITADKLTTKNNAKQEITEVIAYGITEPAHYWTLPNEGDLEIHARAKLIKFYPLVANIALEQNVEVKQGQNQFKGELIYYNSKEQTVTVPPAKNSRAVLVYNPET